MIERGCCPTTSSKVWASLALALSLCAFSLGGLHAGASVLSLDEEFPPVTYGHTFAGGWQTPSVPAGTGPVISVTDAVSFRAMLASTSMPGTTYQLADGVYTGIFTALSSFGGTPSAPVTITSKTSLGAVFTGETRLDLSATSNVVLSNTKWQLATLPDAVTISAPSTPKGSGRGHRITGNFFDRVGNGGSGSVNGIIKADHPAKGRPGGWVPSVVLQGLPAGNGLTVSDIYEQGYGISVEDLDLMVDNNLFDRPANPALWLSNGLRGVVYARNNHVGTPTIIGFEKELVKIGFGWPQGTDCNIKIMNNTFSGDAAADDGQVAPYVIGIKELGAEVAFNQFLSSRARVSSRLAPMNFHNNAMVDGRIYLSGNGNRVKDNYIVSMNPPFSEALILLSADAISAGIYDGTAPYRPFYSIRADNAQIENNTFISKTPSSMYDVLVSVGWLGTLVTPPTGALWKNNVFVRINNPTNFLYSNGVATGVWSGNTFHTHNDAIAAQTAIPEGALASGGRILQHDPNATTTSASPTTLPSSTTTTFFATTSTSTTTPPSTSTSSVPPTVTTSTSVLPTATTSTTTSSVPVVSRNVGLSAVVTASSESVVTAQVGRKVVDGLAAGYPGDYTREWASSGGRSGSWVDLRWSAPELIERIVLFDRPNPNDWVVGGSIAFSDGSVVNVGALNNGGAGTSVVFPARVATGLRFTVTGVGGSTANIGLSELQVWTANNASVPISTSTTVPLTTTTTFFATTSTSTSTSTTAPPTTAATTTTSPTTTSSVVPGVSRNMGLSAVVTASSESPGTLQFGRKVVDGFAVGYPGDYTREWASAGGKSGSWVDLRWASAELVDRIVLFDRPNVSDWVVGGSITFSDGSVVSVGALNNVGSATTVVFPARAITGVRFTVTSVGGSTINIGLSELQVWTKP